MNKAKNIGLAMTAAMTLLLVFALLFAVDFDRDGLVGLSIGAGLGVAHLLAGTWLARRSLRNADKPGGMTLIMGTMLGSMFFKMVVLIGLLFWFHSLPGVDEVAFALAFMIFFFAYLGVLVTLVERVLSRNGSPA